MSDIHQEFKRLLGYFGIEINGFDSNFSNKLIEIKEDVGHIKKYKLYSNNAKFLIRNLSKKGSIIN
jgi:hypothetical protein